MPKTKQRGQAAGTRRDKRGFGLPLQAAAPCTAPACVLTCVQVPSSAGADATVQAQRAEPPRRLSPLVCIAPGAGPWCYLQLQHGEPGPCHRTPRSGWEAKPCVWGRSWLSPRGRGRRWCLAAQTAPWCRLALGEEHWRHRIPRHSSAGVPRGSAWVLGLCPACAHRGR